MKPQANLLFLAQCATCWFMAVLMVWATQGTSKGSGNVWFVIATFATVRIIRERRLLLSKQEHARLLHEWTFLLALSAIGAAALLLPHDHPRWVFVAAVPFWIVTAFQLLHDVWQGSGVGKWIQNELFNTQPTG